MIPIIRKYNAPEEVSKVLIRGVRNVKAKRPRIKSTPIKY